MVIDAYTQQVGLALVQLTGFFGLCLARLSLRSRQAVWLQAGYFGCLVFVAAVLCWGVKTCSPWWLITGTTLAMMIVGPMFHCAEEREQRPWGDDGRELSSEGRF